jgi:hypothetical protein
VLTQNDRQQFTIFDQGKPSGTVTVPRPQEATDAFFRFAELRAALLLEGGRALLLYGPGDGRKDVDSLLLCLDLNGQTVAWATRAPADRIAYEPSQDPDEVYLFGSGTPLRKVRFPGPGKAGQPKVEAIDLPAEVVGLSSILPTGRGTFLTAHSKGLSAFLGPKGWVHHPPPERTGMAFRETPPVLLTAGGSFWWQPFPGRLFQVRQDGEVKSEIPLGDSFAGKVLELDSGLLCLLGADPSGNLWFGLAPPLLLDSGPVPPSEPASKAPPATLPAQEPSPPAPGEAAHGPSPEERARWEAHLKAGLARVYRWDHNRPALRLYRWSSCWEALGQPAGFQPPAGDGRLRPGSGGILLGGERHVAWIPIHALGPGEDLP